MSLFFTGGPVTDFAAASAADTEVFRNYFWHMTNHGNYIAPSQFEAGFLSLPTPKLTSTAPATTRRSGSPRKASHKHVSRQRGLVTGTLGRHGRDSAGATG